MPASRSSTIALGSYSPVSTDLEKMDSKTDRSLNDCLSYLSGDSSEYYPECDWSSDDDSYCPEPTTDRPYCSEDEKEEDEVSSEEYEESSDEDEELEEGEIASEEYEESDEDIETKSPPKSSPVKEKIWRYEASSDSAEYEESDDDVDDRTERSHSSNENETAVRGLEEDEKAVDELEEFEDNSNCSPISNDPIPVVEEDEIVSEIEQEEVACLRSASDMSIHTPNSIDEKEEFEDKIENVKEHTAHNYDCKCEIEEDEVTSESEEYDDEESDSSDSDDSSSDEDFSDSDTEEVSDSLESSTHFIPCARETTQSHFLFTTNHTDRSFDLVMPLTTKPFSKRVFFPLNEAQADFIGSITRGHWGSRILSEKGFHAFAAHFQFRGTSEKMQFLIDFAKRRLMKIQQRLASMITEGVIFTRRKRRSFDEECEDEPPRKKKSPSIEY